MEHQLHRGVYLQICEKYKEDYEEAIRRFKAVRKEFVDALSSIDNLHHSYASKFRDVKCLAPIQQGMWQHCYCIDLGY